MKFVPQCPINTLRPSQNGHHFPDDIFKCNFLKEILSISINISPNFVSRGWINNIPALVQMMARHRAGNKPLYEPMLVCFSDAYMRHVASMS